MDETEFKSIWAHADVDDTRWTNVGVRMAEIINLWVNDDATAQVTNTAVTPILEQISEEAFRRIKMASKEEKYSDINSFIDSKVASVMTTVLLENDVILRKVKSILGHNKIELVSRSLPSSTTSW